MTKISFNPQALGAVVTDENGNVRRFRSECAFIPVVVSGPGVEAIYEGLRLSNVEGFMIQGAIGKNDEP